MEIPKICDWVSRRAECSIEHLFMLLVEVLDADTKMMQTKNKNYQFALAKPAPSKAVVSRMTDFGSGIKDGSAVVFELTRAGSITATKQPDSVRLFEAKPSLDAAGECRLEINGEGLYLWQVSRKALEDLFFAPGEF